MSTSGGAKRPKTLGAKNPSKPKLQFAPVPEESRVGLARKCSACFRFVDLGAYQAEPDHPLCNKCLDDCSKVANAQAAIAKRKSDEEEHEDEKDEDEDDEDKSKRPPHARPDPDDPKCECHRIAPELRSTDMCDHCASIHGFNRFTAYMDPAEQRLKTVKRKARSISRRLNKLSACLENIQFDLASIYQ